MASFSKGFAQGFVPNFGPMLNNAMQLDSRNRALQLQRAWQQEQLARDDERARIADNERQIRLKLALEADTRAKEDQVRQEGRYQGGLKQTQIEDESALEAIASMFPGAENSEKAKIAFNVWKAKRQLPDQVDPNKALDAEATGLGHEVKRAYDQASDLRRLAATVPATDMATRKKYLDQADDTERSVAPYVRRLTELNTRRMKPPEPIKYDHRITGTWPERGAPPAPATQPAPSAPQAPLAPQTQPSYPPGAASTAQPMQQQGDPMGQPPRLRRIPGTDYSEIGRGPNGEKIRWNFSTGTFEQVQ